MKLPGGRTRRATLKVTALSWVVLAALDFRATPLSVEAQQTGKVPRIAVLTTSSPPRSSATDEFIQGLRDLGYIEGRNVTIEWRWGHGTTERFPEYAADVVRFNVDVILAANAAAAQAARLATKTIPIVIPTMDDPVADGFVASLARPGGTSRASPSSPRNYKGSVSSSLRRPCRACPEWRCWRIATSAGTVPWRRKQNWRPECSVFSRSRWSRYGVPTTSRWLSAQ